MELLPAAADLYGYGADDIELVLRSVRDGQPQAQRELVLIVRQWRIDLVSAGFDVPARVPEGVSMRARIQFALAMGRQVDVQGRPYSLGMLDWEPEPVSLDLESVICPPLPAELLAQLRSGDAGTA